MSTQPPDPYSASAPTPPGPPYGAVPYQDQLAPPQQPKKSGAGKIILIILAILAVLCVGGGVGVFFLLKDDVTDIVEATQTRLVTPDTLNGRPKVTQPELQAAADTMITGFKADLPDATSTVGAFYGNPEAQDLVMIAGVSALIADPSKELDDAFAGMTSGGLTVTNIKTIDAGPLGGEAKCGDGDAGGVEVGVCAWADRGSLGMVVIYFADGDKVASEFVAIRGAIQKTS